MAKVLGVPILTLTLATVAISDAFAGVAGFVNIASQEGSLMLTFADGYGRSAY